MRKGTAFSAGHGPGNMRFTKDMAAAGMKANRTNVTARVAGGVSVRAGKKAGSSIVTVSGKGVALSQELRGGARRATAAVSKIAGRKGRRDLRTASLSAVALASVKGRGVARRRPTTRRSARLAAAADSAAAAGAEDMDDIPSLE